MLEANNMNRIKQHTKFHFLNDFMSVIKETTTTFSHKKYKFIKSMTTQCDIDSFFDGYRCLIYTTLLNKECHALCQTLTRKHNSNVLWSLLYMIKCPFLRRYAVSTGWWEIDIHGCYSLVKINLAPICTSKNNRRIWRHNNTTSRSHEVTGQLWWQWLIRKDRPSRQCRNDRSKTFWAFVCSILLELKKHIWISWDLNLFLWITLPPYYKNIY